jgi:hypothetical protein
VNKIVKLHVIPPPSAETATTFTIDEKDVLIMDMELESHLCGNCGFVLAENIMVYNYRGVVLQCPNCKSYNGAPNSDIF